MRGIIFKEKSVKLFSDGSVWCKKMDNVFLLKKKQGLCNSVQAV